MLFTKEIPKEEGFYWYADKFTLTICELSLNGKGGPRVSLIGWDIPEPITSEMLFGNKIETPTKELKND